MRCAGRISFGPSAPALGQEPSRGGVVTRYIDPAQQTAVFFGARSHWLQPWRAYLDTPPAEVERRLMMAGLNHEDTRAEGNDLAINLDKPNPVTS